VKEEEHTKMRGVTVVAGGGVEGYTGALKDRLQLGPSYGVGIDMRPSKVLGVELGYTGAVNEINGSGGANVVRNGGQALLNIGLTATPIQPYLIGGVGVNNFHVQGGGVAMGYRNDTGGDVPLGAGLRTHFGSFTADARFDYRIPFEEQFAPVATRDVAGLNSVDGARYQATLNIGSTF